MDLKRNVGPRERVVRLGGGIAAGAAAMLLPELGLLRIPLGLLGFIGLATGSSRYCPVNEALGIDNFTPALERARRKRELHPSPGLSQY